MQNPKIHSYYENGDICKNLKLALKELDKSEVLF
jgi:hypothetical protein